MPKMSLSYFIAAFIMSLVVIALRIGVVAAIVVYSVLIVAFYLGQTHGFTPFWL